MPKISRAHLEAEYREPGGESFIPLLDGYDPDGCEDDSKAEGTSPADPATQDRQLVIELSKLTPGGEERELNDLLHWYINTIKRNFGKKALLNAEQEKALARDVEPMRHYRRLEKAIREKVDDEADPRLIAGELVRELVRRVAEASPMLCAAGRWLNLPMGTTLTEALEDPDLQAALHGEPEDEMVACIADILNINEEAVRPRLADLSRDVSILPEKVLADHGHCELHSLSEALGLIQAGLTMGRNPDFYSWSFREVVSRGEEARDELVESNLRLACRIAVDQGREHLRMDLVVDMIGAGNLGLLRAAEKFDHRRGARFSTYATTCIQNEISSFLFAQCHAVRLPRQVTADMREVTQARQQLEQEFGRDPSWEEIAEAKGMPVEKVEHLVQTSRISQPPVYLSKSLRGGAPVRTALAETLADPHSGFEERVCDNIMRESPIQDIGGAVEQLPERQRQVLQLRYFSADGELETLETVGQKLGISRQSVSQLEKKAIKHLRNRLVPSD